MGEFPCTNIFKYDELLSDNNLTQSWTAIVRETGEKCFLKLPSENGSLGPDETRQILTKSFRLQSLIGSSRIITASKKHFQNGCIVIEYPLIDPTRWRQLQKEQIQKNFLPILTQVAIIVDYLHLLGLVHCDLKFENFLLDLSQSSPHVVLLDLDCLTESGSDSKARIIGTPGHLPPEVIRNGIFSAQSDNFSLGRSLSRHFLSDEIGLKDGGSDFENILPQLRDLVSALTATNPSQRPASLLEGFHQYGVIDEETFDTTKRSLLSMFLLDRFRVARPVFRDKPSAIRKFLHADTGLIGIHPELVSAFETAYSVSPLNTYREFKSHMTRSEIARYGDFWHVRTSDSGMLDTFESLSGIAGDLHAPQGIRSFREYLVAVQKYRQDQSQDLSEDNQGRAARLQELAQWASEFDRPHDVVTFLRQASVLVKPETEDSLRVLTKLARQLYRMGEPDECEPLVERGIEEALKLGVVSHELDLRGVKAWIHGVSGESEKERDAILDNIQIAQQAGLERQLVRAHSGLSVVARKAGDQAAVEKHLLDSIAVAKQAGLNSELGYCLLRLSYSYAERSLYRKAMSAARLASKYLVAPEDAGMSIHVNQGLVYGFLRMGQYRKAEYWLERHLDSIWQLDRPDLIAAHYGDRGWLESARGNYDRAKGCCLTALSAVKADTSTRVIGKAYHNLAEIAAYQGDHDICEEYLASGFKIFSDLRDEPSLAELELIGLMNKSGRTDSIAPEEYIDQLKALVRCNCAHYSLLCMFHILLTADRKTTDECVSVFSPLKSVLEPPQSPLAEVVDLMITGHTEATDFGERAVSKALKTAYGILQKAGQVYLSTHVCRRIANIYAASSKDKLATKFLVQARTLAEFAGNSVLAESLAPMEALKGSQPDDRSRILQVFLGISKILKDIRDYDRALQQMVEFAVEETGAERGVFLVREKQADKLYVKSFVNCDDESLLEITDISRTLPERAAEDLMPLVIEDALSDKSTKSLKSIVAHNIRSVMCIPVSMPGGFSGVLYLDHHTIPALFEENDITFVRALANSLSVIISTIEQFKGISVVQKTLSDDLANYGIKSPLVTRNEKMRALINSIPQIAATSATILITGESGTGKEILCQMIHDNSPRSDRPLVKMNCAAIASSMIESELFGIAKNAATGVSAREGKFEAADGGTLFLDEIGDMQLDVQPKLLRVVEHLGFERVGSNRTIYTDQRLIFATNQNLEKMVDNGKFRQDLYFRINTIIIEIPPLRERPDDIELLINHFTGIFSPFSGKTPRLSNPAIDRLINYSWPGNVRELRNLVERLCILQGGQVIRPDDLPGSIRDGRLSKSLEKDRFESVEKHRILVSLRSFGWNQSKAADSLDIPLTTFRRKMSKYDIRKDH